MTTRAIVIAGTSSGAGKTTVATGLMGALVERGLKVQPFKVGPDYIDPGYHTQITGQYSRNLDTWMLPPDAVIELFERAVKDKDIAVIEGVMGLYDGRFPKSDDGSTAELAKLLKAPVLLVVDSRKSARSVAAMVGGFRDFDTSMRLGGVILNGIGSEEHFKVCREAIEHYTGVPVVGYLPRRDVLALPERHLGLVPTAEIPLNDSFMNQLVAQCRDTFDISAILSIAERSDSLKVKTKLFPPYKKDAVVKIGVARDKAFSFYYQDSLDLLESWGAELVFFSPLNNAGLPPDISGLYLGGGFPELYAGELSRNEVMKRQIKTAVENGIPVYAECGGLMYLGESIRDFQGNEHAMVGAITAAFQIEKPRLSLGYRTVVALNDGPILRRGETIRGHEFHWSVLKNGVDGANAYRILNNGSSIEGFQKQNLLASYIHLHLGSSPQLAPRFVNNCRIFRENCR
jgi:cobyrinic acid a,c-diamide synthase